MEQSQSIFTKFDQTIDKWSERSRGTKIYDQLCYWASHLAEFSILWQLIGLATLLPFVGRRDEWLRLLLTLFFESVLVNQVIKRLTNRARPEASLKLSTNPRRPSTTSLPSGHASSATVAAILLSVSHPSEWIIWVCLALLVSLSRIHNRVHHASDVVAGVVTGFAIAGTSLAIFPLS